MSEETLFKTEQKMSSAEISEYLKMVANKFRTGDTINLKSVGQKLDWNLR